MTNQQILEKAITKYSDVPFSVIEVPGVSGLCVRWSFPNGYERIDHMNQIIFNHDFAKAIFGTRELYLDHRLEMDYLKYPFRFDHLLETRAWKFHLQCMVIAEDPIQYLGEHI